MSVQCALFLVVLTVRVVMAQCEGHLVNLVFPQIDQMASRQAQPMQVEPKATPADKNEDLIKNLLREFQQKKQKQETQHVSTTNAPVTSGDSDATVFQKFLEHWLTTNSKEMDEEQMKNILSLHHAITEMQRKLLVEPLQDTPKTDNTFQMSRDNQYRAATHDNTAHSANQLRQNSEKMRHNTAYNPYHTYAVDHESSYMHSPHPGWQQSGYYSIHPHQQYQQPIQMHGGGYNPSVYGTQHYPPKPAYGDVIEKAESEMVSKYQGYEAASQPQHTILQLVLEIIKVLSGGNTAPLLGILIRLPDLIIRNLLKMVSNSIQKYGVRGLLSRSIIPVTVIVMSNALIIFLIWFMSGDYQDYHHETYQHKYPLYKSANHVEESTEMPTLSELLQAKTHTVNSNENDSQQNNQSQ